MSACLMVVPKGAEVSFEQVAPGLGVAQVEPVAIYATVRYVCPFEL